MIMWIIGLCVLSAILGRMGGAKGFNTKYRDVGCSLIKVVILCLLLGFQWKAWWIYLLIFGLHWAAYSTYWDWLFGYDNFWFSGFMVGCALFPACLIIPWIWWIITIHAILLGAYWGCLHKFMKKQFLAWTGDVAEELLRYLIQ